MVYCASSLVGARISAWVLGDDVSIAWRALIEKVAVLPVPD